MSEALRALLFRDDDQDTYVIIDGASCGEMMENLDAHQPDHECLYTGDLEPDVVPRAPYLVALPPEHSFTDWFLANFAGKHWGIFLRSTAGLRALRKHFRTFLLVKDPAGKRLYFRYYDPRVLRTYLPTCNAQDFRTVFGPVTTYVLEGEQPGAILHYTYHRGNVETQTFEAAT